MFHNILELHSLTRLPRWPVRCLPRRLLPFLPRRPRPHLPRRALPRWPVLRLPWRPLPLRYWLTLSFWPLLPASRLPRGPRRPRLPLPRRPRLLVPRRFWLQASPRGWGFSSVVSVRGAHSVCVSPPLRVGGLCVSPVPVCIMRGGCFAVGSGSASWVPSCLPRRWSRWAALVPPPVVGGVPVFSRAHPLRLVAVATRLLRLLRQ